MSRDERLEVVARALAPEDALVERGQELAVAVGEGPSGASQTSVFQRVPGRAESRSLTPMATQARARRAASPRRSVRGPGTVHRVVPHPAVELGGAAVKRAQAVVCPQRELG